MYRIKTEEHYKNYEKTKDLPYSTVHKGLVDTTTSHGLPHIAMATGTCKRSFWFILTLLMVSLWITNTYYILEEYLQYEVTVNLQIESKKNMDFPAVTICNQNVLRRSAIEEDSGLNTSYSNGQGQPRYDPGGQSHQKPGLGTSLNQQRQRAVSLYQVLAEFSSAQKQPWGHQLNDFILVCHYTGYQCDRETSFYQFYNSEYGNCFTFNSGSNFSKTYLDTSLTGPSGGLQVILNIQQDEYLADITEKAGARVFVHPQTEMPFPEDKGFDVGPGQATAVGMRKLVIKREGGRYGDCLDTSVSQDHVNAYEELYPWTNYTARACDNTCLQRALISNCDCYDVKYPSTGSAYNFQGAKVCKSSNETQANCSYEQKLKLSNEELDCQCIQPCYEVSYDLTISTSAWPAANYQTTLKENLANISTAADTVIQSNSISSNFVYLEIYYEDLNLETMEEEPAYEESQFVADFGGAIGLWVGASMITVFEFGEYFLDLLVLFCSKCRGKKLSTTTRQVEPQEKQTENNIGGNFNQKQFS